MKFLFASVMSICFSFIMDSIAYANDVEEMAKQINQDVLKLSIGTDEHTIYEDIALIDSYDSHRRNEAHIFLYRQLVEVLANNEFRSEEGRALNQAEANLLVKYFVQLKLDPAELLAETFHGSMRIAKVRDKGHAIQIVRNIANTRNDMNQYLDLGNVKCFFRNYTDPNAVFEDLHSTFLKNAPLIEILNNSDEATIIGKCRGYGLLKLPEFGGSH